MKSKKDIRETIHRYRMLRAGSIYPKEFEAGAIYALMWVLNENPNNAS